MQAMRKKYALLLILLLLLAGYIGARSYLSTLATKEVNAAITRISPYTSVQYKNVSVNPFTMHITISDVTLIPRGSSEKMRIAAVVVNDIDKKSKIPEWLSVEFRDIEADLSEGSEEAENLKKLGYTDKIFYDMDIDYIYDRQKKELFLKRFALSAKNMGSVAMDIHLGNIAFDQSQLIGLLFTYPSILLYDGKILYTDDSLMTRIMQSEAKKAQKDIADYKKMLIANIKEQASDQNDAHTKEVLTSMEKFINNPNKISISVLPQKPQPLENLMRLQDPAVLLQLLNLHISAS